MESEGILARQWSDYRRVHHDRTNLVLHAITNPIFLASGIVLLAAPFFSAWLALGALGMPIAMALQGLGHRLEREPPAPFASPLEAVARVFTEQWITFPRYVLTGGFARAWRADR